jgi:hypothetical protein
MTSTTAHRIPTPGNPLRVAANGHVVQITAHPAGHFQCHVEDGSGGIYSPLSRTLATWDRAAEYLTRAVAFFDNGGRLLPNPDGSYQLAPGTTAAVVPLPRRQTNAATHRYAA